MRVLILSKTHFGSRVCVGGMVMENSRYVRLLNPGNYYQFADTELNIGDIWDMNLSLSQNITQPHNEDVIINSKTKVGRIDNLTEYILGNNNIEIWRDDIDNIFENKLQWSNGKGFLSVLKPDYPRNSVGFWLSDKPLTLEGEYYSYPTGSFLRERRIIYKGIPDALSIIPAGTLLRVSLAKWWQPDDGDQEKRCYAQLSGWYELK